jgi:uncharacterized protein YbbK (DUF523 family)
MKKILISECLCGVNCKYNGLNNYDPIAKKLLDDGKAIAVCPEVMGGLKTPRVPAEIVGDKVISKDGEDVTKEYIKGANIALKIALDNDVELAVLQARSPSCGSSYIYDGTYSNTLVKGEGVTTKLLREHGVKVMTIDEFKKNSI